METPEIEAKILRSVRTEKYYKHHLHTVCTFDGFPIHQIQQRSALLYLNKRV